MVNVNCLIFTTNEPISKLSCLIECSTIVELRTKAVEFQTGNFLIKKIGVNDSELDVYEMENDVYCKCSGAATFDKDLPGVTRLFDLATFVKAGMFYVLVGPSSSGTYNHSNNQFHIPPLFVSAVNHSGRIIHCFY